MQRAHAMPFGAEQTPDGVRFALWAPSARDVRLVHDGSEREMPAEERGWRRLTIPEAHAGSRYGFRVDGDLVVPDPASRFQPDDVHGQSLVVDPGLYRWSDESWSGRPWEETVLYELHVGTATPEGTYAGLANHLEDLRDLGVTAVELMPINDFAGKRNWGYDGVLPYAPDATYGTPDDLRRLVDRAHGLGLMVFLDVVYNHFGPAGNYLHAYAKTFFTERHQTPWGAGINVDGESGEVVRDFFVHNALYWLEEFHIDGLRFDAVHAIQDDSAEHIIGEIARRVRETFPDRHIHLVLENERNEARWLARNETQGPKLHTAQWNDDIHHCWHVLLTGERDAYYEDFVEEPVAKLARCLAEGFAYQGEPFRHTGHPRGEPCGHLPPSAFVAFLQNHDQIGNRAMGERISALAAPEKLVLARAGLILSPQIPMLFMGEEWAASNPFQFFVDFAPDEELSKAVREGRRREFSRFPAFADPEAAARIPDPTDEATFIRSRLDWDEAARSPHREVREEVRELLRRRHDTVVPLTKTPYRGAEIRRPTPDALEVTWRFEGGSLTFCANFGAAPVTAEVAEGRWVVWTNSRLEPRGTQAELGPWTGIFHVVDRV